MPPPVSYILINQLLPTYNPIMFCCSLMACTKGKGLYSFSKDFIELFSIRIGILFNNYLHNNNNTVLGVYMEDDGIASKNFHL